MNTQSAIPNVVYDMMDNDIRRQIIADPRKYAEDAGMDVAGKEVVVATCPKDVLYIPIQQVSADAELSSDELGKVSGGMAGGTLNTVGTGSTLGCVCTSLSSASTAGTAG